ncbi:ROK family glucokinase [Alkalicoccus saliphilus]|jgi:glucokinase|uniref:Glucokinase n=1 Tax=Alkalicoccus saliphilus TaxID=200989 RepID=A0A2T4UAS8_9BACI|nr:ROK family glucokinase [Alkalicoccus saliphilus]PTL40497.1 glucokinase [Alkalicoccus saliphilus]
MKEQVIAGIDVGGTTIKIAFITEDGEIKKKWEITTNQKENGKYIMVETAASIKQQLESSWELTAAGVGAPGFIDVEQGFIYEAVNLGWKEYELKKELEALLQIPVVADNDANLAAGGEKWKGAGEGARNLLAVTLGTGVGGGIIAGGQIIHGESGMAGEIGHITALKEGGAPCNCGKRGCLETVASATGIARLGLEAVQREKKGYLMEKMQSVGTVTAKDVLDGAKLGDPVAEKVVDEAMEHLGLALANLCNSLNPETIVLGGGVSKAGDFIIDKIKASFQKYAIPKIGRETKINLAALGNDAGVIGAAWLAKEFFVKEEG